MAKCCVFFAYFIVLDYICLNIGLWSSLAVATSAAIVVTVSNRCGGDIGHCD